jgi:S1-C subfamily serine protease
MLYAWETHGLDAAAAELHSKYGHTLSARASEAVRSFHQVVKGRLAYLHMVRGQRDPIYVKLAKRFNKLGTGITGPLPLTEPSDAETALMDAVFVVEVLYDDAAGVLRAFQGTGFVLAGVGFVTAAHVVADKGVAYKEITAYSYKDTSQKYILKITTLDMHRDLAVGVLMNADGSQYTSKSFLRPALLPPKLKEHVALVGYPAYKMGQTPYWADAKVASIYGQLNVAKFEISTQIREGNSGGPVMNESLQVVGIAVEGAEKGGGNNAVVQMHELYAVLQSGTNGIVPGSAELLEKYGT